MAAITERRPPSAASGTAVGRPLLRDALLIGNALLFGLALLVQGGSGGSPLSGVLTASLVMIAPVTACFALAVRQGPRRVAALWMGIGMLFWTAGNVTYAGWTQFQVDPPVPSPADVTYFAFYLCLAVALVSLARRDMGSFARVLWLDGALGAAGAATVMALVLRTALTQDGVSSEAIAVSVGYAVGDVLLVAMICGLLAVRGGRGGPMWSWLALGLAMFCAADVLYALQVQSDSFVAGTLLSVLWMVGITIMCMAIWRSERPHPITPTASRAALLVPMASTLSAVCALAYFSIAEAPVIVALATGTLLLAAVRTAVSFHQVQALSIVRRQALTDELTGLGNRRDLFQTGADQLRAAITGGDRLLLMLLDLDDFKLVNDTLGHQSGDELLREVSRRLAGHVRRPDLVTRLGGDEFALLIRLGADSDAQPVADRVLDLLTEPVVIGGTQVRMRASAGIAESAGSEATIAELLRRADVAMYAAKGVGKRLETYDAGLDRANLALLQTIRDLDAAFLEGQFVVHYQPKVAIGTGALVGGEALVRWAHPTRGLLYPDAFLPTVEQSGSMARLTDAVLGMVVGQLARWRAVGLETRVAVNLSTSDLLDEDLPARITSLLSKHAVPVDALELEVTESVLMTDPARASELLGVLHAMGLRLAIDDYGTGYCSLAYLRDFPIDELKIDRSFIADLREDPRNHAIVRSTVDLAHALNLRVVAEGVEDATALETLRAFGCDSAQGFHFSRPLPPDDFAVWARSHELDPPPPLLVV